MKKLICIISIVAFLMSHWSCDDTALDPVSIENDLELESSKAMVHKSKLQNKEFESESLFGNPIENSAIRKLQVYTPPGYDKNRDLGYPVIYLLHGFPFSEKAFIDYQIWDEWINPNGFFKTYPDFPQEGFQAWIDDLILSGKIDPLIIVMPNANNANYGFSWYSDSALNGNFEQFISTDLVKFIDKRYNTISNRSGRSLIGHSQGGYGAVIIGMKYPNKFSVIAAHGAPLFFQSLPMLNPFIVAENPDGLSGPDPNKFLTSGYYSMAAAWSPNLLNPPFMVDLPMEFPSGELIDDVWANWLNHDPFFMLDAYSDNFRSLNGIFIDCGDIDEFGWGLTYDYFFQKMDYYGINYLRDSFQGGHVDKVFSRLELSVIYCSNTMGF
jgi:S-formylglutathione hydrolase